MEHMRRRQAYVRHPQPEVATEFEHVNTSKLPDEAPRRRMIFAEQSKEQAAVQQVVQEIDSEPPKRRTLGRPPKNKQSA